MIRGAGGGDNLDDRRKSSMNAVELIETLPAGLHRVRDDDGTPLIAKIRRDAPDDFFPAEARGLAALRHTQTLRVPAVFAVSARGIAMEDLGSGRPRSDDWERAGAALARLHRITDSRFGFDADGWCGDSPQDNTRDDDGYRFFAQRRIEPQVARAYERDLLDDSNRRLAERICAQLPQLVPTQPASLTHGDLWIANLHACANGELALIDGGAVHYGWAEADLAMLTLFGEPPPAFFASYAEASGVDPSWRERAPIYNLYHLLNHLNLFGSGYFGAVRAILRRYG